MPELILLGTIDQVRDLDPEENPGNELPCFPCENVHLEARAQLYARLLGVFYEEALTLEQLVLETGSYGPFVYQLDQTLQKSISAIAEDDVESLAADWAESADMDSLGVYDSDLLELLTTFLFNLIHFCLIAAQESELNIYVYSDG